MKKIIILSSFFIAILFISSCKDASTTTETTKKVEQIKTDETPSMEIVKQTDLNAKEYTAAYTCPMHCVGSGSDKPGKCPACKMDLTKNLSKGVKLDTEHH